MPTITRENAAAFQRPLYRPEPVGPVQAYKTYSVARVSDQLVPAVCEQVGCLAWRHGWDTPIDESSELGRRQAAYIRQRSGRTFREQARGDGLTVFRFEARQRCFRDHQTQPTLYVVRQGDWRGYGRPHVHTSAGAWVDDFASHQDRLAQARR